MLNEEVLKKMVHIRALLDNAYDVYNTISREEQNKIIETHNEQYNLAHCLREGLQASEDLCEDYKDKVLAKEAQED